MSNHYRVLYLLLILGCVSVVPREVRLYSMETGNVISGQIEDARQTHGSVNMLNSNTGESFSGEYTSIPSDQTGFAYGSTHWATAYGFSFSKSRMIYGEAILIGNAGTIIEIVYAIDRNNLHGHGVGRDNHNNRYKVHF